MPRLRSNTGLKHSRTWKTEMKRNKDLADMYAHRGYHDKPEIPENSMAAFRRAIKYGLPTEIDVHRIADGTLVIFHDDDLERVTGVKGVIEDYDITNLRKLRLEGTDEMIPTFDEVLDLYEDTGLPLLIELKVNRRNYAALTRAVAERLDRYRGRFAVQSFDPRVLLELRKIRPQFTRGQLSQDFHKKKEGLAFYQAAFLTNLWLNILTKPDFISYKYKDRKNRALRRSVDKRGKTEASWTIRTPKALKAAVKAGCIPIFEKIEPEDLKEILGIEPEEDKR